VGLVSPAAEAVEAAASPKRAPVWVALAAAASRYLQRGLVDAAAAAAPVSRVPDSGPAVGVAAAPVSQRLVAVPGA